MIRKATVKDIDEITALYMAVHTAEEEGKIVTGWKREIYPTRKTVEAALDRDDMYVLVTGEPAGGADTDGESTGEERIVAAAAINKIQGPEYSEIDWEFKAPDHQVMIIHTLAVLPTEAGKGYGKEFVAFYEDMARNDGCTTIRIDTQIINLVARGLYAKLGFQETGIVDCVFNGIPGVHLVCMEKKL